ncbi:MAG: FAD:protein FMN transferase [Verrucomicrobiota bacterium]
MMLIFAGCHAPRTERHAESLERFEFTKPEMGLPFRIVLYASNAGHAETAARAAFARIEQLNAILSDYEYDSELSALSRTAGEQRAIPVSRELWHVLARAQDLARRTDGAFDVTVGPFVSLWRKARREKRLPEPERLAEATKAVGFQKLHLDPRRQTAELKVPRMRLDLGGIAKGYAIDEALKTLQQHGIRRALVSGGGDMAVSDPPPGQRGWRIEIAPLDVPNAPPKNYVELEHGALATSGDVFQRLEIEGRRYSHIVDPKTGVGLADHSLVTVIARDCMTADSLATAVSVLGPKRGLDLVEKTPGAAAYIVRMPGTEMETFASSRLKLAANPE